MTRAHRFPSTHRLFGAALAVLLVAAPGQPAEPAPYILAVHPYLAPREIHERFDPLAQYLSGKLGRPVEVRVGSDYEEHERFVGENRAEIAYMGPVPYVQVVERYGPKPLLARAETSGKPYLTGVIFVRRDSAIRHISELKGKSFAFGDVHSTTGSIVARYVLRQNGIGLRDLARYSHIQSHDNVLLAVRSGDFDAGAMRHDVFDEMGGDGLRAIAELPPVSEHVFVARADLSAKEVSILRRSLQDLRSTPEGVRVLHAMSAELTGLVPARDDDYDNVRRILRTLAPEQP